jgi:hypothetical protein
MAITVIDKNGIALPNVQIGLVRDTKTDASGAVIYTDYWIPPNTDLVRVTNRDPYVKILDFSIYGSTGVQFSYSSNGNDYLGQNFSGILRVHPTESIYLGNPTCDWVRLHSRIEK